MRELRCDICGTSVKDEYHLETLTSGYRVDGITDVCKPCMKALNEHHAKLTTFTQNWRNNWMREFIKNFALGRKP